MVRVFTASIVTHRESAVLFEEKKLRECIAPFNLAIELLKGNGALAVGTIGRTRQRKRQR